MVQTAAEIKSLVKSSYELIDAARDGLAEAAPDAVATLRQLVSDPDVGPGTRARAAETILKLSGVAAPERHEHAVAVEIGDSGALERVSAHLDRLASAMRPELEAGDIVEAEVVE